MVTVVDIALVVVAAVVVVLLWKRCGLNSVRSKQSHIFLCWIIRDLRTLNVDCQAGVVMT